MLHTRASGQRHREYVCLLPPVQTVAGHAAHGQRRQHHANAEIICHWQPGSQLVENVWNNFSQVAFWNIATFCHRQMGHNFRLNRTSQFGTSCMVGVFILVLQYKDINSSQFVEIFKVKTTSLYGAKKVYTLVLFSFLEKCVFSPRLCSSKLDIVHLA